MIKRSLYRPIFFWLSFCFLLVFVMILIGGITRLTDSGLSMVEWRPIYGFLPPLSVQEWQRVFALYQQIPEYQFQNLGMSLDEFKNIFWWEYIHRLWGRLIGLCYALPLVYFWFRGKIPQPWRWPLIILFFIGGAQGGIGWWMVKSGLVENLDVSAFRLMVHLGIALIILISLWGFIVFSIEKFITVSRETVISNTLKVHISHLFGLTFMTILSGALVAGNDAGLVFNDWPLMNGTFIPDEYDGATLFSWAQDQATVQFHHRILAYILALYVGAIALWVWSTPHSKGLRRAFLWLVFVVMMQGMLGVMTVLTVVHTGLAIVHHAHALILLLSMATVFFFSQKCRCHEKSKFSRA